MTAAETLAEARRCHQAGDTGRAAALYRRALDLNPADGPTWYLLGAAIHGLGRAGEAATALREAVRLLPHHASAWNHLGVVQIQLGGLEDAAASFQTALHLQSDFADAHKNMALLRVRLGQPDLAEASLRQLVFWDAGQGESHFQLGRLLRDRGKADEALACFREALRLDPRAARFHNDAGLTLAGLRRFDEAVEAHREAVALAPADPVFQTNLAAALCGAGDPFAAEAACRAALRLKPEYAVAHAGLGATLAGQNRPADALACYDEALRLDSSLVDAHWNRALAWLQLGDFARGWPEYEWRWRRPGWVKPKLAVPAWDGAPLTGGTVLLWSEQGLGDTLQFVRYVPLVRAVCGRVVLVVQPPLVALLKGTPGADAVVPHGEPFPPCDRHTPLLSLPLRLRTTLENVPAGVPYLRPETACVERWRAELSERNGFRVGVVWRGSPGNRGDCQRSFPIAGLATVATIPGVRLVSLQKGPGSEEAADAPFPLLDLGGRLDNVGGAFLDTAAAMASLDLVVSADTAVAHLAGALGRPVWIALPFAPDWRWLDGRDDSPWYPTVRLFRQERPGDWAGVFGRIATAIRALSERVHP